MKKLLSIVLALALCLTAFVGCLTVSAAGENTIVVDTANITTGAATTDVNVTITSAGVMALQFAIDYGTLAAPAVAYDEDAVTVTATEDKTGLLVEADGNFTSTVITLTFDTAALTAGTYAIAVNDVEAGNYDEAIVAFETTAGAIVVADEVVEPAEPVLDETIVPTIAINITEKINARIVISKEISNYADFELVVARQNVIYQNSQYDLSEVNEYVYGKDEASSILADGRALYLYNELAMYELGVDFSVSVRCYDEDGNYVAYSNPVTTNIGKLAYALYSPANASAKNKNIAIDIAKLGDEAQKYMVGTKTTCGLATVTSPLSYFPAGATEGATFDAAALDTTNNAQSIVAGVSITPAVNLSANPSLRYLVNGTGTTYAQDTLKLDIDYTNGKYATDGGVEVAGNDLQVVGTANTASVRYLTLFSGIALYDSNAVVTATLYSGDTALAKVDYSIEAYVAANHGNKNMGAVLKAVANLGTSARAYFGM